MEDWLETAQAAASSQALLGGSVVKANRGGLIVRLDNGLGGTPLQGFTSCHSASLPHHANHQTSTAKDASVNRFSVRAV